MQVAAPLPLLWEEDLGSKFCLISALATEKVSIYFFLGVLARALALPCLNESK